jgi:Glycosyltransferase family 87
MRQWEWRIGCVVAVALAGFALHRSWTATSLPARDFWLLRAVGQGIDLGVRENVYSASGRHALARALVDPAVKRLSRPGIGFDPDARRADGSMTDADVAAIDAVIVNYQRFGEYGVDTVATPTLLALIDALSTGEYSLDRRVFAALSIGAFLFGVALFVYLAGYPPLVAAIVASATALVWRPYVSDVEMGNLSSLQLGVLAAVAWTLSRRAHVVAGALLGVGAVAKPTTALVVAAVVLAVALEGWRDAARLAAGVAAGAILAIVAGAATFGGLTVWVDWAHVIPEMLGSKWSLDAGNVALREILPAGWASAAAAAWLLPAAFAAALIAAPRATDDRERFDRELLALATGAALMLLTSGLVWFHYYVLLLPLAIVVVRRGVVRRAEAALRVGGVALALAAGTGVTALIVDGASALAAWLFSGAFVLCILGTADYWRTGSGVFRAAPAGPAVTAEAGRRSVLASATRPPARARR